MEVLLSGELDAEAINKVPKLPIATQIAASLPAPSRLAPELPKQSSHTLPIAGPRSAPSSSTIKQKQNIKLSSKDKSKAFLTFKSDKSGQLLTLGHWFHQIGFDNDLTAEACFSIILYTISYFRFVFLCTLSW
jgi:hypothetical protein